MRERKAARHTVPFNIYIFIIIVMCHKQIYILWTISLETKFDYLIFSFYLKKNPKSRGIPDVHLFKNPVVIIFKMRTSRNELAFFYYCYGKCYECLSFWENRNNLFILPSFFSAFICFSFSLFLGKISNITKKNNYFPRNMNKIAIIVIVIIFIITLSVIHMSLLLRYVL